MRPQLTSRAAIPAALPAAVLAAILAIPPADALAAERQEDWTGSVFTSSFRAGICVDPERGSARATMHLRTRSGDVDEYHFFGTLEGTRMHMAHSSGHVFEGDLCAGGRAHGKMRMAGGMRVSLDADCAPADLVRDDCAPPPDAAPERR